LIPTLGVGDAGDMWKRATRVGALAGFCLIAAPGGAVAASERFVPAFSFWSGAPIEEEESAVAPSADVSPARAAIPAFRRNHAEHDASAPPIDTPVVNLLLANPSGAPATDPSNAGSDPLPKDETQRWVPALAFTTSAIIQEVNASSDPGFYMTNSSIVPRVPKRLSKAVHGEDRFVAPNMGISLELSTPGLNFLPTRPRLFAHVDARVDFAFNKSVGRNLAPENMVAANFNPALAPPYDDPHFIEGVGSEEEIRGQGTRVQGEVLSWVYSGGLGAAFTLEVFERRLRLKPSAEYMYETVRATGILNRAIRAYRGNSAIGTNPTASRFIFAELEAQKTQGFHMLGPGLEVEMDTFRFGPTVLSLFANAKAFKILSNPEINFTATEVIEDPCCPKSQLVPTGMTQTVSSDFSLVMPEWNYDLGLGLRFRWLPQGGGR